VQGDIRTGREGEMRVGGEKIWPTEGEGEEEIRERQSEGGCRSDREISRTYLDSESRDRKQINLPLSLLLVHLFPSHRFEGSGRPPEETSFFFPMSRAG